METDYQLTPYEDASGDFPLIDRPEGGLIASQIAAGNTVMQTRTGYTTAVTVQKERDLGTVQKRILIEAQLMGEAAYYGWGAGKDRVEGPSQALAYAMARNWGNCALEMTPMQETRDAWIFTAIFIDLETGFTLPRQFRQSKKSVIYGNFDDERKDAMRFAIGQSKSQRNVILKAIPKWMTDQAIQEAKKGCRKKLDAYIQKNGIQAAIEMCVRALAKHGVKEQQICDKFSVAKITGLTLDDLVVIRGDISALEQGQETAATLYPVPDNREEVKNLLDGSQKPQNGKASLESADVNQPDNGEPVNSNGKEAETKPDPSQTAHAEEPTQPTTSSAEVTSDPTASTAANPTQLFDTGAAPSGGTGKQEEAGKSLDQLKADLDALVVGKSPRVALPAIARFHKDIEDKVIAHQISRDTQLALLNYGLQLKSKIGK